MRRALAVAALAALIALPAQARVAVVGQGAFLTAQGGGATPDENNDRRAGSKIQSELLLAIMDKIGGDYDIIPPGRAKTQWCRTGVFRNSAGTDVTYSCVIHMLPRGFLATNNPPFGYRPDSLALATATTTPLAVPQLFIANNGDIGPTGGRDSVGAFTPAADINPAGQTRFLASDPTIRWRSNTDEPMATQGVKVPGGYKRIIVGSQLNAFALQGLGTGDLATNCVDCDSVLGNAAVSTTDTGLVWIAKNANTTNSKPIIIVDICHYCGVELDGGALLMGLAVLDSMTNGDVFAKSKLPLKAGIQIRGGWRRNLRSGAGGITDDDSTNFKAVVDSLATLKVPFVVGVNIDSLADYPDEKRWWERAAPYVHYAPEQWAGAVTDRRAGNASWQLPYDPLGNARTRAIYGDGTAAGKDTSMWALIRACYWKLDSTFGVSRVDRVIMGANFRWLPTGRLADADSVIVFLGDAGVRGVVTNARWGLSGPTTANTNPLALGQVGGKYPIRYGRQSGSYLLDFTTAGYADSGSAHFNGNLIAAGQEGYKSFKQTEYFWRGLLSGRPAAYAANWPGTITEDSTYWKLGSRTMRIFTLHVGDLGSGTMADAETRPSRNGWWQIKSLVNQFKAINIIAGRTVVKFDYPDRITAP